MDKSSIEQIFMFFNCTMARDIPRMGKIVKSYVLGILGHPNAGGFISMYGRAHLDLT